MMMTMKSRLEVLFEYLDRLERLKKGPDGYNCYEELRECIAEIRKEMKFSKNVMQQPEYIEFPHGKYVISEDFIKAIAPMIDKELQKMAAKQIRVSGIKAAWNNKQDE